MLPLQQETQGLPRLLQQPPRKNWNHRQNVPGTRTTGPRHEILQRQMLQALPKHLLPSCHWQITCICLTTPKPLENSLCHIRLRAVRMHIYASRHQASVHSHDPTFKKQCSQHSTHTKSASWSHVTICYFWLQTSNRIEEFQWVASLLASVPSRAPMLVT